MNTWRIDYIDFSSSIDLLGLIGKYVRFNFLNEQIIGKVSNVTAYLNGRTHCLLIDCHIGTKFNVIELTLTSEDTMTGRVYE